MKIIYAGPFGLDLTSPGTQRVLGMAQTLVLAGHDVTIAAGLAPAGTTMVLADGIHAVGMGEYSSSSKAGKLVRAISWGDKTRHWIDALESTVDTVFLYGGGPSYVRNMRQVAGNPQIVVDVVEWYDPRHMIGGRLGPLALTNAYAMSRAYPQTDGIVAISSFLQRHFGQFGIPTVVVPPTVDLASRAYSADVTIEGHLRLAYAGTPGRKDSIAVIAGGVESASRAGISVSLDVYGPTAGELEILSGRRKGWDNDVIRAHGPTLRTQVLEAISGAHFVPLLRPDERYAHAGFPTKIVEAMSLGTPAICNATSDLAQFVVDGQTGILADSDKPDQFADAISRAAALSPPEYKNLRQRARRMAEVAFAPESYVAPINSFLESVANADR